MRRLPIAMQGPGYLAEVATEDGLRLKGFWQTNGIHDPSLLRLWILVHGVSGNFYDSSLLSHLSSELFRWGNDVVRINTRGHDPVAYLSTNGGMARVGAAYEMLEDAKLDIAAWVKWGHEIGYERIGLLGHSLGAVKVALATSDHPTSYVDQLICVSPPRLNAAILAEDENYGEVYAEQLEEAKSYLAQGKPEMLMNVRFPQPMLISVATFFDKYGGNQNDYFAVADQISCPSLWSFGEQEVRGKRSNFRNCDGYLTERLAKSSRHRVVTIPNCDHNYSQNRDGLSRVIKNWMDDQELLI